MKDVPNLIVTPNTAWISEVSLNDVREQAAQEVRRAIIGRVPEGLRNCINKEYLFFGNGPASSNHNNHFGDLNNLANNLTNASGFPFNLSNLQGLSHAALSDI